ncbi:hypothetical protein LCGC14_1071120, partial [marine sediment metagenome]
PELAEIERADVELSFRVKENEYKGNTTLEVSWIAEPDASPTRTVTKISKEDAQALQARYAPVLAATKVLTKAVSAKGKGKKTEAKTPTTKGKGKGRPVVPKTTTPKTTTPETTTPETTTPETTTPETMTPVGKCTLDEAYDACFALKRDDVTEERLNELWVKFVAQVNADETMITDEQAFEIKEKLLKVTAKV